jgi:large subunit ribosomal protein L25
LQAALNTALYYIEVIKYPEKKMARHELKVQINEKTGGNSGRTHRSNGFIPATVSHKGETDNILLSEKDFHKLLSHGFKKSSLVELQIPGKDAATSFLKSVQRDPVSHDIQSVEFYQVTFGEKIQAETDVRFTGTATGEKMGGLLEKFVKKLRVECLPKDLPEEIVVDVSGVEMNAGITIGDLSLPEGVEVINDAKVIVCLCHPPKKDRRAGQEEASEEAASEEAAAEGE